MHTTRPTTAPPAQPWPSRPATPRPVPATPGGCWVPPPPPPPPPGPIAGPGPVPPVGPATPTPPPAAPRRRGSRLLIALLVAVSAFAVAVIAVSGVALSAQRDARADRTALAAALAAGDTDAVEALVERRPSLLDTDATLALGDERDVEVADDGATLLGVRLEAGVEYVAAREGGEALVLVAPGGGAEAVAGPFVAAEGGVHTVAVVGDDGEAVTASVEEVPTHRVDFPDGELAGEVAVPGQVVDHVFEVQAGQHYVLVDFSGEGLTTTFLDEAGEELDAGPDQDGDLRLVAPEDGTARLRVQGASASATGSYTGELLWLAEYSAFYDVEGAELPEEVEPTSFRPVRDEGRGSLSFCLFIRSGIALDLTFTPDEAGTSWEMDLFTSLDASTATSTSVEVQSKEIGLEASDEDRHWCFDLHLVAGPSSGMVVGVTPA